MAKPAIKLGYPQQLEFRRIEQSAGVIQGTLAVEVEDNVQIVIFDIATEATVHPPAVDIRAIERVSFVYKEDRRFGETGPSHVLCTRDDFPRNIVHLCAGTPGCPAAPCLAIAGLQPLYERAGIEAVMVRLRDFLRDAKTGTLIAEGWEPVPFGVGQTLRAGEVIPRFFQEHATAHPLESRAVGTAINFEIEEGKYVIVFPQEVAPDEMANALAFRNEGKERRGIPWVFLWPPQDKVETDPIFADWQSGMELREGMRRIGVDDAFDVAVGDLLNRGLDFRCHRPPQGGKGMVVVLGVWRPEPIMSAFFGYSDDPLARRLELRAFMISQALDKEIVAEDAQVETIAGDYPASPELFSWVAGVEPLSPVAMLGMGALGSAIYNNLARSGLTNLLVYDKDVMLPHNLARHTARVEDLYKAKGDHAEALIRGLARDMSVRIVAKKEDVTALPLQDFKSQIADRLIIDATADERVRLRMDELRAATDTTIIRTEMFHEGRLGVAFVSPPRGPSLSDMMLTLIAAAPTIPAVADWLDHEARHPFGPKPMLYGFGCTSQTVRLPLHAVAQQAASATSVILGDRSSAGIGINSLDMQFRPTGWRWLPVESFDVLTPPTESEWRVRIAAGVIEQLKNDRQKALPSETGGYLYGICDPIRRTITIARATSLPPESVASSTSLELGPAGATAEERRLKRTTHDRIYLCGTWHSHPKGSARMSGRDHKTMMGHHARDLEQLSPTLLVIVADDEIQAHLKVP
jgi:hypothetical protein